MLIMTIAFLPMADIRFCSISAIIYIILILKQLLRAPSWCGSGQCIGTFVRKGGRSTDEMLANTRWLALTGLCHGHRYFLECHDLLRMQLQVSPAACERRCFCRFLHIPITSICVGLLFVGKSIWLSWYPHAKRTITDWRLCFWLAPFHSRFSRDCDNQFDAQQMQAQVGIGRKSDSVHKLQAFAGICRRPEGVRARRNPLEWI